MDIDLKPGDIAWIETPKGKLGIRVGVTHVLLKAERVGTKLETSQHEDYIVQVSVVDGKE